MTGMTEIHDISTVVMYHPSRRPSADRVVKESQPLNARLVEDPDPTGVPSPLRTAKVAWDAVEPGTTHHLVLQDDVHLCPGFDEHVRRLIERFPRCAISLGVLWVSPYNCYRVREAAVGGFPVVHLAPWEWVPSLGLILPAETARELAAFLRTFPDVTRDDDEHIAVFCAERDIPVVAPVPHLLDHSTRPSVAGNDHHGIRLAVSYIDRAVDPGFWAGPVLEDPGSYDGLGFAVDLVESRCNLRIRRREVRENAEQPFTWPWRPWSELVGVPEPAILDAEAETLPPQGLPAAIATELWATGFILGARCAPGGDRRPAYELVRDQTGVEGLRSWLTAGLEEVDRSALGPDGVEVAIAWLREAVEAGRAYAVDRVIVERMALREARHLLLTAPDELPDIRLEVRACAEDGPGHAATVTEYLSNRWLGEHVVPEDSDVTLAALACERLEPRALVGLARLVASGWAGIVETRAATATRLRAAGLDGDAMLAELDAAEERFGRAESALVTLPASSRTSDGGFALLSPHADPAVSRWNDFYRAVRSRAVSDVGL